MSPAQPSANAKLSWEEVCADPIQHRHEAILSRRPDRLGTRGIIPEGERRSVANSGEEVRR